MSIFNARFLSVSPVFVGALVFCLGLLSGNTISTRLHDAPDLLMEVTEPSRLDAIRAKISHDFDLEEQIAQLMAIGYLGGADANLEQTGVVQHVVGRVQQGINLYNPAHEAEAYLIDLEGNQLHRWALPLEQAFPDGEPATEITRYWRRVRLLDDGGLLAIYEGVGVVRIDRDSQLIWSNKNGAHHDLDFTHEGQVATLRRKLHINPEIHPSEPVLEDFIELLDPQTGESLETFSVYDAFAQSSHASAIIARADSGDVFHTNTLQVLDGTLADAIPAFARGNYLISMRSISVIAVIDAKSKRVVWSMAGQWKHQHEPQVLANGNLLIFDNSGNGRWSKVIEFDPRTQEIYWAYYGTPENEFHSKTLGSQQRLANGNTLITETTAGRVREISAQGEEVWRFHSPHVLQADDPREPRTTARICEMLRVEPNTDFLRSLL